MNSMNTTSFERHMGRRTDRIGFAEKATLLRVDDFFIARLRDESQPAPRPAPEVGIGASSALAAPGSSVRYWVRPVVTDCIFRESVAICSMRDVFDNALC